MRRCEPRRAASSSEVHVSPPMAGRKCQRSSRSSCKGLRPRNRCGIYRAGFFLVRARPARWRSRAPRRELRFVVVPEGLRPVDRKLRRRDQVPSCLRSAVGSASTSAAERKSSAAWAAFGSTTNPAWSCTSAWASPMIARISLTEISPRRTAAAREAVERATAANASPLVSARSIIAVSSPYDQHPL
jgi:hypothetical protein